MAPDEVSNPPGQTNATPLDPERLTALRRQAAAIERPLKGVYLQVKADGTALTTGPKGLAVPESFRSFAHENGLPLYVARRGDANASRPLHPTIGNAPHYASAAMPIPYRESGAIYYSEMGDPDRMSGDRAVFSRSGQRTPAPAPAPGAAPGNLYTRIATRALDNMDRVLDPLGTLPDRDSYLKRRYKALGSMARGEEIVKEIRRMFFSASASDKENTYNYLTTADSSPDGIQSPGVRSQAIKVKKLINEVGDALVKRGLLPEGAREALRDAYLPQLYLKYLLTEPDWLALGGGKKASSMDYLKQRKHTSEEFRRVRLGEVKEPGFLSAMAIARPLRDMALLDWLQSISENEQWVLQNSIVTFQRQRVSPYWLKEEAVQLRRQADYYNAADATKARALAKSMDEIADQALEGMAPDRKEYRQLPNDAKYGRLRGIWVRKEIYDDISGVNNLMPTDPGFVQSVFGYGGIGTKVTQIWKMGKVALNPPAQVRNFVSNAVLLQLSGVSLLMVPVRITQAWNEIVNNGEHWKIAKNNGVTESTFASQELFRMKRELLDLENELSNLGPLGKVHRMAVIVAEKASDLYQFSEALFKTAKIIDEMEKGADEATAVLEAQRWLFDYSLVHKNVRYLRSAPIGMPFVTFQIKILPRMLEVAALHPQRFLPWVALMYGFAYGVAAAYDVYEDDIAKLKKAFPKWVREMGHGLLLPWKDAQGRWQAMDVGYFFPWTYWTKMADNLKQGDLGKTANDAGLFSGPVTSLLVAMKTGRDPFTNREIMNPADPPQRQLMSALNYLWSLSMPPIITEHGALGHTIRAATGETNRFGDPRSTYGQAALRVVGVNIYALDPELTRGAALQQMQREVQDTKQRLLSLSTDRGLTDAQRERLRKTYTAEIKDRIKKMQEYAEESKINPKLLSK